MNVLSTAVQAGQHVPGDVTQYGQTVLFVVAIAFAIIGAALALRRRTSRDNREIAKDRAETDMLSRALADAERYKDDARKAWDKRAEDAAEIAGLKAENEAHKREIARLQEAHTRDVARLNSEVARLRASLDEVLRYVRKTNPGMPDEAIDSGHAPLHGDGQ